MEPLIGRPLIEGLRLNTTELKAAYVDRFECYVDVTTLPKSVEEHGVGRVSIVQYVVFQSHGGLDEGYLEEDLTGWSDIADEPFQ